MGFCRGVRVFVMMLRFVVAIRRVRLAADVEPGGADTGTNHRFGPDGIGRDCQAAKGVADVVELHTGIDEGTEDHVARRARKAVEIENGQGPQSYRRPSRLAGQDVLGIKPASSSEQYRRSPRMMWSTTSMPITMPAFTIRFVRIRSSSLGVGSPEG